MTHNWNKYQFCWSSAITRIPPQPSLYTIPANRQRKINFNTTMRMKKIILIPNYLLLLESVPLWEFNKIKLKKNQKSKRNQRILSYQKDNKNQNNRSSQKKIKKSINKSKSTNSLKEMIQTLKMIKMRNTLAMIAIRMIIFDNYLNYLYKLITTKIY